MKEIIRKCNICDKEKSLNEFTRDKSSLNGFGYQCLVCKRVVFAKWFNSKLGKQYKIAHRIKAIENEARSTLKFPEKRKAREILRMNVRSGNVQKLPCEFCGDLKSEAHHTDYSKPLDVRWLCKKHHVSIHQFVSLDNQLTTKN